MVVSLHGGRLRFISRLLAFSLLVYCGCHTTGIMSRDGLRSGDNGADITVFARDSLQYRFSGENYHVQGDTLTGYGMRIHHAVTDVVFQASLPLADVDSVETKRFDLTTTVMVAGGIGLVAVGIVALLNRQNRTGTFVVAPTATPETSP
jgi:hypothetical protein